MGQISDGLWGIIRSSDGMSSEISETVQSVYNRLMDAKGFSNQGPVQKEDGEKHSALALGNEVDHMMSDSNEPNEPPGFSLAYNHPKNGNENSQPSFRQEKISVEEQQEGPLTLLQVRQELNSVDTEHKQAGDCSDEDPDVPPGFG